MTHCGFTARRSWVYAFSDEFVYAIQTVFTTPNNIHVGHKEYLAKMESQEQELSPSGYMMLPTAYK